VNWELTTSTFAVVLLAIGLSLLVGAVVSPSTTKFDIFSSRFDKSIDQLQKFYDWKISQYSGFGTSLLGGLLSFVGSVALEKNKNSSFEANSAFYLGVGMTLFLVMLVHLELRALRVGYLASYSSLARLSEVARLVNKSTVEP
jgi:hypothetical protein